MIDFIYRTEDADDDGDPYDFGSIKAANSTEAVKHLTVRYDAIGIEGANRKTRLYECVPFIGPGVSTTTGHRIFFP